MALHVDPQSHGLTAQLGEIVFRPLHLAVQAATADWSSRVIAAEPFEQGKPLIGDLDIHAGHVIGIDHDITRFIRQAYRCRPYLAIRMARVDSV